MIKTTLHTKSVTISGKIVHLINVDLGCFVSNNLYKKNMMDEAEVLGNILMPATDNFITHVDIQLQYAQRK
jgi:hypothetical protein